MDEQRFTVEEFKIFLNSIGDFSWLHLITDKDIREAIESDKLADDITDCDDIFGFDD
jgi:hypothetical protein